MKNRIIFIVLSIMLIVTVGTVSCDTTRDSAIKDTTGNEKKYEDTNKEETIKENNIAKENLEDNKTDEKLPSVNEDPTKESPIVEEKVPEVKNTPPITDKQAPATEKQAPSIENKTPIADNKAPTIDNNTSITNDSNEGKSEYQFMADVEQMIFKRVNEERSKAGVPTLTYNTTMEKYARIKSKDMGDRGYFSHNDPEGNLITEAMKVDGVSYKTWGENIAYIGGVSDATAIANQFMTNWMNSQGHRENILSTNFSSMGVGVYKIDNKVYATQEFYK